MEMVRGSQKSGLLDLMLTSQVPTQVVASTCTCAQVSCSLPCRLSRLLRALSLSLLPAVRWLFGGSIGGAAVLANFCGVNTPMWPTEAPTVMSLGAGLGKGGISTGRM